MKTWPLILSVIIFQLTWASAAFNYQAIAIVGVVGLVAILKYSQAGSIQILIASGFAIALGVLMDGILHRLGIYQFPSSYILFYLNVPTWLLIMWAAFATTLFSSFYWALNKPIWFVGLCSILGPASYLLGRNLGIIQFQDDHGFIMAVSWAVWALIFIIFWHTCFKKMAVISRL